MTCLIDAIYFVCFGDGWGVWGECHPLDGNRWIVEQDGSWSYSDFSCRDPTWRSKTAILIKWMKIQKSDLADQTLMQASSRLKLLLLVFLVLAFSIWLAGVTYHVIPNLNPAPLTSRFLQILELSWTLCTKVQCGDPMFVHVCNCKRVFLDVLMTGKGKILASLCFQMFNIVIPN